MVNDLVIKLVEKQIALGNIRSEEVSVYQYGYTLLLERAINIIITVCISIIMSSGKSVLLFLLAFVPIRSLAGGWHSKRLILCTFWSNLVIVLGTLVYNEIDVFLMNLLIIELSLFIIIVLLSPVQSNNRNLTKREENIYKKRVIILLVINYVLEIFLYMNDCIRGVLVFLYAHIVITISLIMGKIQFRD